MNSSVNDEFIMALKGFLAVFYWAGILLGDLYILHIYYLLQLFKIIFLTRNHCKFFSKLARRTWIQGRLGKPILLVCRTSIIRWHKWAALQVEFCLSYILWILKRQFLRPWLWALLQRWRLKVLKDSRKFYLVLLLNFIRDREATLKFMKGFACFHDLN